MAGKNRCVGSLNCYVGYVAFMQTTVGNHIEWHFVNMGVMRDLFIAVKVFFDLRGRSLSENMEQGSAK